MSETTLSAKPVKYLGVLPPLGYMEFVPKRDYMIACEVTTSLTMGEYTEYMIQKSRGYDEHIAEMLKIIETKRKNAKEGKKSKESYLHGLTMQELAFERKVKLDQFVREIRATFRGLDIFKFVSRDSNSAFASDLTIPLGHLRDAWRCLEKMCTEYDTIDGGKYLFEGIVD